MSSMKCLTCGGLYDSVQKDGSAYFHTCPAGRVVVTAAGDPAKAIPDTVQFQAFPVADIRNENTPSTTAASATKMLSAGKGAVAV